MSETKALVFTFAMMMSLTVAAYIGLTVIDAKDGVLVAVIFVIACVGALAISEVVMRSAPPDERRR